MKQALLVAVAASSLGLVAGFILGQGRHECGSESASSTFASATEVAGTAAASLEMLGNSESDRLEFFFGERLRASVDHAHAQMADVTSVDIPIPNLVESAARVERFARSNESYRDLAGQAAEIRDHLEKLSAAAL